MLEGTGYVNRRQAYQGDGDLAYSRVGELICSGTKQSSVDAAIIIQINVPLSDSGLKRLFHRRSSSARTISPLSFFFQRPLF